MVDSFRSEGPREPTIATDYPQRPVHREIAPLLAEGKAALEDRGHLRDARELFVRAAFAASELGDDEGLGVAVVGWNGLWVHESRGVVDGLRMQAWRERALARLPATSLTAQRLALRVAAELDYIDGAAERVLQALADARDRQDRLLLGEALSLAHHCLLGPEHAGLRLSLADELVALGATDGRPIDLLMGLTWRTIDLVLAGDPHADRAIQELHQLAEARSHAATRYVVLALRTMQAIRLGHLDDAEQSATRTFQFGEEIGDMDASGWYGAHMCAIRWYQGRTDELVPLISELAASPTMAINNEAYLAALAVCAASAGQRDEASGALRRLRGPGLHKLRSSSTWLLSMHGAAVAAHLLGDGEVANEVAAMLQPYAGRPIMASLGVSCFGSAWLPLALTALTTGRINLGIEHLQQAIQQNEALGNLPAKKLALELLSSAGPLADAAEGFEASIECRREDSRWVLTMGTRTAAVTDCVGVRYLAVLLDNPGQEIRASELAGLPADFVAHQPVVDSQALAAYRRRLTELEEEIADARGNEVLLDNAQREYDAITTELLHSQGLGGRVRTFTGSQERARTSVQKAIKRALARLQDADALIADTLARRLTTGFTVVYRQ